MQSTTEEFDVMIRSMIEKIMFEERMRLEEKIRKSIKRLKEFDHTRITDAISGLVRKEYNVDTQTLVKQKDGLKRLSEIITVIINDKSLF
jgi:hypothetical protein